MRCVDKSVINNKAITKNDTQKLMATKHEIQHTLWASDLIPNMMFNSEADANLMDYMLRKFTSDAECIDEFRKAENCYASAYAVQYAINNCTFHFNLKGPNSDELIEACENMIDMLESDDNSDCYTAVMNYIFGKLNPGVQEKLVKIM